ncbi:ACT domain-containing protein [Streptomyces pseudovenezuelae]|uniref:Formyltetrahydrofolate hydrolase n=1 Tax=Streptomyces pseudovenezuelae TaxID=67350 RepID=A0ABT6LY67_9ACTN|nr:ACT domain-containing protein [Streptomyces pseudovenezuelae]MDH6220810.1 formyltetrahydrofolate hydrolase [Streptomyces pseudovenezuelae]
MTLTAVVPPRAATGETPAPQASLIVQGADATGIVAAVTSVLSGHGANIVSLDQYSDNPQG